MSKGAGQEMQDNNLQIVYQGLKYIADSYPILSLDCSAIKT